MFNSVKFLSLLFLLLNISSFLCLKTLATGSIPYCKEMLFNGGCKVCEDGYTIKKVRNNLSLKAVCHPCHTMYPNCRCLGGQVYC